jgi:phage terminase large subunit-like protein
LSIDLAVQRLMTLPPEERELVLAAFEDKRKKENAVLYWATEHAEQEKFRRFYDRIEEDFSKFTGDIKIFALLGGNRSSKTERGAFLAVAWLMGKEYFRNEPSWRYVKDLPIPEHGANIWAVGLDFSVIRDVIWNEKLRRGHRHPGLLPPDTSPYVERISDSEFQITVNVNGRKSSLTAKSAESGASKFQSASVDLLWFDEEVDEEVFNEGYQRTVDCAGKILLTLTPLTDVSSGVKRPWVHRLHKESVQGRGDAVFIRLNTLDNPYIPEEEKLRLKEKWAGHPEEGARLYGDFIQRSGLVYDSWNTKIHFIKPFRIEREWRRIVSIDPAATGITAVVWAAISPRNDVYIYRTYYERNKTVSDHCKDILIRNGSDQIDMWLLDPFWGIQRNNETHKTGQSLYRENGLPVRLAPRAEDYGVNTMREYLAASLEPTSRHPKMFVFDTCTEWRTEVEGYVWATFGKGSQRGLTKDKPQKGSDHLMNATQYLLSTNPKGRRGSAKDLGPNLSASYT